MVDCTQELEGSNFHQMACTMLEYPHCAPLPDYFALPSRTLPVTMGIHKFAVFSASLVRVMLTIVQWEPIH